MKKFSQTKPLNNPYSLNSLKGKLYKLVESKLSSDSGNLVGIEQLVEKIDNMFAKESIRRHIGLLEKARIGIFECDEVENDDDFSAAINSMKPEEDITDEQEDNFSTEKQNKQEELSESLSDEEVKNFLKKLNS